MPRLPITRIEASSKGLVALVLGVDLRIADQAGNLVAATGSEIGDGVAKIEAPGKEPIQAVAFSRDGTLFAACTGEKAVVIYSTGTWAVVRAVKIDKRPIAMTFDPQSAFLLVADKSGDAYRVSATAAVGDEEEEGSTAELLLGHVSILCDIQVSFTSPPLVLTCDRDEKLRISRYPNAYNIQAFGLGHKDFVTTAAVAEFAPGIAVTGSGDGTVRLWQLDTGRLLQTVELKDSLGQFYADGKATVGTDSFEDRTAGTERYGVLRVRALEEFRQFVVAVERIPAVVVFSLADDASALSSPHIVEIAQPPTDIAVADNHVIVACAPASAEAASNRQAVALSRGSDGALSADEPLSAALDQIPVPETDAAAVAAKVPSIYTWGSKLHLERPKDGDEEAA
ncbi:WD repeat-containing protein 4 [Coemansia sp. RSA 552]|nr:WD repeat-containing protein 4 [Coemansia sp. RSA 552]